MKQTSNGFRGEYSFLSNFHPYKIEYMGLHFESVEIAFQSAKCELFSEAQLFTKFTAHESAKAKKLGRKIKMRSDWEQAKLKVMEELLRIKFSDSKLSSMLIDTSGVELIEFNDWGDRFYGVCRGVGRNELGKLLMKIREEFCNHASGMGEDFED